MQCECGGESKVLETRGAIRRRQCEACGKRFKTEERLTTRMTAAVQRTAKKVVQAVTAVPKTAARRLIEDMKMIRELEGDDPYQMA